MAGNGALEYQHGPVGNIVRCSYHRTNKIGIPIPSLFDKKYTSFGSASIPTIAVSMAS
jgi:hypothetical protein